MKNVSAELQAHYESGSTTLARLWRVQRTDGLVFAFTDHDRPITFEGLRYMPSSSFDASANSTRSELNVDNLEAQGALDSEGITAADIEAGRWDGAEVELREVNWNDLTMGANVLRVGTLGQAQRKGGRFVTELRGLMQALQNNLGRTVTPTCDAELGDARCKVDLAAYQRAGEVVSVQSRRDLTADGLAVVSGYFSGGLITFTSGANAGISVEIKTHTAFGSPAGGATLALQLPTPFAVEPGDTFTAVPGCGKRKQEDCIDRYANVVNFRGFSFVPGQDAVLKFGGQ